MVHDQPLRGSTEVRQHVDYAADPTGLRFVDKSLYKKHAAVGQRSDKQLGLMRNAIAVDLRNRGASKVNLHTLAGMTFNISTNLSDPVLKLPTRVIATKGSIAVEWL